MCVRVTRVRACLCACVRAYVHVTDATSQMHLLENEAKLTTALKGKKVMVLGMCTYKCC